MAFEQAGIKVEKEKEFAELKSAVVLAFSAENVEKFLKRVSSAGFRVRDFELVLAKGIFEQIDGALADGLGVARIGGVPAVAVLAGLHARIDARELAIEVVQGLFLDGVGGAGEVEGPAHQAGG